MDSLGRNITLPIYNADGTSFHGLELKKFTFDSVVMALGDKITGELYYPSNTLSVNQTEYVVYDGVKYYLINPPTIVKEGMKADNGTAKGMTKYSFTFYHPMFMLYNFPFTDVAVTSSEEKYKSQDKNFFWIGNLVDYVAKLNKNLQGTEWVVEIGSNVPVQDKNKLSEVLSFNDQKIADALKTGYDTWEIPYIIDIIASTDSRYAQGKRFLIRYGLPSQEILVENEQHQLVPYVFQMGQGVGLKNDSRTPKNNKIVTRIAGYGSEDNVPFGYPQILWTGNQTWNYTINNSASAPNSYPIYDGIVAGQRVRLIHHPFTRSHLMPTIYADTVNKKVNPYASGYDPTIEIKDYYDAVNDSSWTYPNPIIPYAPSYEIHEFSDIKPELGEKHIISAAAFDGDAEKKYLTLSEGLDQLMKLSSETNIDVERGVIRLIHDKVESGTSGSGHQEDIRYVFKWSIDVTTDFIYVKFASSNINFEMEIHRTNSFPSAPWDDAMDDDGNYKQSYFNITLPQLDFDLYACAAVTQEMTINMRSGACLGCSFPVEVDWEDYKKNFYDSDGNFAPTGSQRDYNKYPDSSAGSITIICKKEIDTFGTLMPNIYQQPKANDKFVILGISLPTSYITNAQLRLDHDMCQYMLDNNVHYFEWPLKFDEFFLTNHTNILAQMKPNILVRFNFASEQHELYIKQISVKYGEKPLPQYNITLTDDIEIVLSPIGRVTDEVSSLRVLFGGGGSGSGDVNLDLLSEYFLSKQNDDTAAGMIRFLRGLQVGENFVTGLLGEGGIFRVDDDGTTYIEADKLYIRMRAYFDTVEVKKYLHSGGNRIASKAGINCSRVEWIDANGDVTNVLEDTVKFRCYFRANGENGREITNDFVVNDLAFCKETNVDNTSIQQHGYWRCVIGVSSSPNEAGEHWIDLSKSDCQSGSNIPLAQDDIIQLGHKTDNTRQGAIVEFVGGEDAPSYQIYQGINSYDLTDKNYVRFGYDSQNHSAQAYIGNPDGSTYLWYHYVTEDGHTTPRLDIKANVQFTSPESSYGTQDLNAFISAVTGDINNIHSQIDGQIESWFYDYMPVREESGAPADTVPLTNKEPYKSWYQADHGGTASEVTTERIKHLGDTFYDNTSGYAFRFSNTGTEQSPVFAWVVIQDSAVIKALADAAKAQDTADHKRRAFVLPITIGSTTYNYPYPPYDVGDLWLNAKHPYDYDGATDSDNNKYNNDVLRCITPQGENGSFNINHWVLASKYTDDTELRNFLGDYEGTAEDLKQQIDKKAETWYQDEDPSLDWYVVNPQTQEVITDVRSEHVGDLWYCTAPVSATPPDYYDATHGGNKTWQYKYNASENRYYWAYQNVPLAVFDRIDGKAQLFVQIPNVANPKDDGYCYRKDDMWILESDNIHSPEKAGELMVATQSSTSYNPDHWVKKLKYTDDLDAFVARYVQDLIGINTNITNAQTTANNAATAAGTAQTTADNAAAAAAAADYLRQALTQATDIVGGLVLATTIGLRDSSNNVWAGINGAYQASETGTGYKGHGIAAWYGGGMIDGEVTDISGQAKSLFRFDGSGYVAGKNISWDKDGNVTIQGTTINATTLQMGGSTVAKASDLASYVTLATDQTITGAKKFSNAIQIGDIYIGYDSQNNALKVYKMTNGVEAAANFYATGGVSALGSSSSGGGGGVTLNQPLLGINQAGLSAPTTNGSVLVYNNGWKYSSSANIFATGINVAGTASAAGFSATGKDDTYVLLAGGGTKLLSEIGGGGSVVSVSINGTSYSPDANGDVNLGTGYLTGYTDTKNTTGGDDTSSKIFLVGMTAQTKDNGNARTYTQDTAYVGTDGCLYSGSEKVLTGITSTMVTTALGFTPANSTSLGNYLPLTGGSLTGFLYLSRTASDGGTYKRTDNRIYARDSGGSDEILLREIADINNSTSVKSRTIYFGGMASISNTNVAANTQGVCVLSLGNSTLSTAANSMYGYIRLYGQTAANATKVYYCNIQPSKFTDNRGFTLPDKGGTFALTSDIPTTLPASDVYSWAKASTKPSYTLDEVSDGTTRKLANYLPLSGGTMSGHVTMGGQSIYFGKTGNNAIMSYSSSYPNYGIWYNDASVDTMTFSASNNANDATKADFAINGGGDGVLTSRGNKIWHAGNDGSGSGLDADTVDGMQAGDFMKITNTETVKLTNTTSNWGWYFLNKYNSGTKSVLYFCHGGGYGMHIRGYMTDTKYLLQIYNNTSEVFGVYADGRSYFGVGNVGIGTTSPAYSLDVVGTAQFGASGANMKIRLGTTSSSAIVGMVDAGGTSRNVVQLNSNNILFFGSGTASAGYQTTFRGHKMVFVAGSSTQVDAIFISNQGKVMIGSSSAASYMLHVTGDIYATGGITALSDAREKNVIGSTNLTVEDIAMMKAVNYRWKDGRDNVQHVGSIAQDWQRVLPEVVMRADDKKGTLSLQYGVAALVSSIVTARKVVDHERRIAELERENRELKEKLKIA